LHGSAPEQYLEQYRGCHYLDCINPDEHLLVGKSFDLLLSGVRGLEIVVQLMSGDGRRIRAEIQATPRLDGEKIVGVQGMIRGLSKRKVAGKVLRQSNIRQSRQVRERDQELRRNAATGSLAASIAHEFNNHLCGVRSVVERMARKSELAVAEQGLLELALEQCDRMKRLIRNLKQFDLPNGNTVDNEDI
jgi:signal transduction histidine kinase